MEKVKVTALQTHTGDNGMKLAGDIYEVFPTVAAELKRNGLVAYDGPEAKKEEGQRILVSDKKEPLKKEDPKEKVEQVPPPEKKIITKPSTKK